MRKLPLLATALLIPFFAGCPSSQPGTGTVVGASPTPPANTPNGITISNFTYTPSTLTVGKGTPITWVNSDAARHTATADDLSFDTGDLPPGRTYTQLMDKPGTYSYHCNLHPTEKGTIVVQ